jgi:hypothetical protein
MLYLIHAKSEASNWYGPVVGKEIITERIAGVHKALLILPIST